jgi:hypothetical protein
MSNDRTHTTQQITSVDVDTMAAWIDNPTAPCPADIEAAMANDPALRGMIRDLRLGRFQGEVVPAHLTDALVRLGEPPAVLATIGRWSMAAAAALAIAALGFQLGTTAAGTRSVDLSNDLTAMGLTIDTDHDALLAILVSEGDSPS